MEELADMADRYLDRLEARLPKFRPGRPDTA